MIARAYRFHGHNSLRRVYQSGKTVRHPLCLLKFTSNERRQRFRVAIVVSRKVSKSAVARNRIRRRCYEVIRSLSPQIDRPYDLVFTVMSEQLEGLPAPELEAIITKLLQQAGVLAPSR